MKQILYFLIGFTFSLVVGAQFVRADECVNNYGDISSAAFNSPFIYPTTFVGTESSALVDIRSSVTDYQANSSNGTKHISTTDGTGSVYISYCSIATYSSKTLHNSTTLEGIEYFYIVILGQNTHGVCYADDPDDSDGDGIPDDYDIYPDDPTDYQVGLFSYQTNSAGEIVRQCFITDRNDVVCFGAAYDSSLTDNLIINTNFEDADSLYPKKDPEESFSEPDDHESSGDFDDDGTANGKDHDIDGDGLDNDYDDNDYQWDENDSDPIDPSDPFDGSAPLPPPEPPPDDLNLPPNDLTGDGNVSGNSDGATSQDIRNLSSDQHERVVYLNSEQSLRHNDLKKTIVDTAEFLNDEAHNRDQTSEDNADLRHNDLKDLVDKKFSALDENQEVRNVKTNSAIEKVETGIKTVAENIGALPLLL